MKTVFELVSATFNEWMEDKAQRLGAALAYYAAFSVAPLLVIAVFIVDRVYRDDSLLRVHQEIASVIGTNAADAAIATMEALRATNSGGFAASVSIIALILGATAAFGSLQDAMNTIWEVTPKPRHFLIDTLRTRLISFLMVLCFCLLLMVSLVASAVLGFVSAYFETTYPITTLLWKIADYGLSFLFTTVVFATLYKVLPDVRLSWSDVSIGAVATAALFTLGKIPLSMYLGHTFVSPYGAAGSVMVLLAWVYYASQILFLGAEFTQVYANRYGSSVRTSRGAVFVSEATRIQEGIPHAQTVQEAIRRNRQRKVV